MTSRYKHDEGYEKYGEVDLRGEFETAQTYLSYKEHFNDDVFRAVDEIYHMLCVKQGEVKELVMENGRLCLGMSDDPFIVLLQVASRSIHKTRWKNNATAAFNVLNRNGVSDIDSLMGLSIIDASKFRNAGSNVLATIAAAQDLQRKKDAAKEDNDE